MVKNTNKAKEHHHITEPIKVDKFFPLCKFCKAEIPPTIHRGRARLFCGRACKFKQWKTKHPERYKELVTAKNISYRRALIIKWNSLNLCRNCGKPRAETGKYCEKCREAKRNYYFLRKNKLKFESYKDKLLLPNTRTSEQESQGDNL